MASTSSRLRAGTERRIGIVGLGHTVFGRRTDATVQELAFEAFAAALADAGLERDAIEASVIAARSCTAMAWTRPPLDGKLFGISW